MITKILLQQTIIMFLLMLLGLPLARKGLLTGRRDSINLKKVFVNPVCIALAVGLVLFFTGFQLPQIVPDSMGYIAGMNTPAAMIVLGFY